MMMHGLANFKSYKFVVRSWFRSLNIREIKKKKKYIYIYIKQDVYNIRNCDLQVTSFTLCLYIEPLQKIYLNLPLTSILSTDTSI